MGIEDDHSMRTYVATDEDKGGKIVGFMRWQVPQGDGKLEEMWPDLPRKSDMDVLGPFFGGMEKNRHDLMGKRPHWCEYQSIGWRFCQLIPLSPPTVGHHDGVPRTRDR